MRVKFDDALETLALLKPRLTFLTAKSASGKTYLSDALKEEGFVILELDNIVRSLGKKYAEGTAPNYSKAYNVYKNQSSNALKKDFISHIHAFIDANYNKPIIINQLLLKELFHQPNSLERYFRVNTQASLLYTYFHHQSKDILNVLLNVIIRILKIEQLLWLE